MKVIHMTSTLPVKLLTIQDNMKIKHLLLSAILLSITASVSAQTIVTIAGEEIPTDDFMAMYKKNTINDKDKITVDEYMQLFINFKLKVKEAEELGFDKSPSFVDELNGYRDQLAKPYLVDSAANERLVEEAYENSKYDIRASHILVNLDKNAFGKDTVAAWNKIMELRNRVLKGEDFNELAFKYSDDPSARDREYQGRRYPANKGDLGYFTAFNMIYPFEHVAFQTKVGEVSMPVRTNYGYHIIYVTDRQPAMGKCTVSHILLRVPEAHTHKDSVQVMSYATSIYDSIMNGMTFEEAAKKYSEDKTSSDDGGRLIPFTCNQIEANFIEAITKLNNPGDVSKPFFSIYGCHIVKLTSKEGFGPYDAEIDKIRHKVAQSDRMALEVKSLCDKLRTKYHFTENVDNLENFIPTILDNFDSLDSLKVINDKVLFSCDGKSFRQSDFVKYIDKVKDKNTENSSASIRTLYSNYVNDCLLNIEKDGLAKQYPEYRLLLQEYHDGILLFDINEEKIWNKSTTDTVGLKNYYNNNRSRYFWKDRAKATQFKIIDPTAENQVRKLVKKKTEDREIVKIVNEKSKSFRIMMDTGTYEFGSNAVIDAVPHKKGLSKLVNVDGNNYLVRIYEILPAGLKSFDECKGIVISDYQDYLEKEWIKELRNKYQVEINQSELNKLR